ncbi:hypothetical protein BD410DRAFT_842906 [Rickenella mellea]|uniref:Uncharacterized protein n=1 Tax=Rickenella mellea TaxID=50990 RepID=A0A4Y7PTA8_9AGAM|nr:hypothetical protein BD410DRAFT_842906 [Rickenella mellea]
MSLTSPTSTAPSPSHNPLLHLQQLPHPHSRPLPAPTTASQGTRTTPSDILTQMLHNELGVTGALPSEAVINKRLSREMDGVVIAKMLSSSLGYSAAAAFSPGLGGAKGGVVVREEDEDGGGDEDRRDSGILPPSLTRSTSETRQQRPPIFGAHFEANIRTTTLTVQSRARSSNGDGHAETSTARAGPDTIARSADAEYAMGVWDCRFHRARNEIDSKCNVINVQIVILFILLLALSLGSTIGSSIREVRIAPRGPPATLGGNLP